jgi:hypothetical protein
LRHTDEKTEECLLWVLTDNKELRNYDERDYYYETNVRYIERNCDWYLDRY